MARSLLVVVSSPPLQSYELFTHKVRLFNAKEPFNLPGFKPELFPQQSVLTVSKTIICLIYYVIIIYEIDCIIKTYIMF